MESKPYNIVLLPEKLLNDRFITASKTLEKFGAIFTLTNTDFFPHLSLYMLQLHEEGLAATCKFLQVYSTEIIKQSLTPKCFHYENEYIDVEYERTGILSEIQNKIIELLNPVRIGLREKDQLRLQTATGTERENLLTYGYRSIGLQFFPHVTLTRFKTEQKETIGQLAAIESFEGIFNRIGIFQMGDNGTCIREVASWQL